MNSHIEELDLYKENSEMTTVDQSNIPAAGGILTESDRVVLRMINQDEYDHTLQELAIGVI